MTEIQKLDRAIENIDKMIPLLEKKVELYKQLRIGLQQRKEKELKS